MVLMVGNEGGRRAIYVVFRVQRDWVRQSSCRSICDLVEANSIKGEADWLSVGEKRPHLALGNEGGRGERAVVHYIARVG